VNITIQFAQRFVEKNVGRDRIVFSQPVAIEDHSFPKSGRKKICTAKLHVDQSRARISKILLGLMLASRAIIRVIRLESITGSGGQPRLKSLLTGFPTASMSIAVGSRNTRKSVFGFMCVIIGLPSPTLTSLGRSSLGRASSGGGGGGGAGGGGAAAAAGAVRGVGTSV
jgi:uncharacterized membrane protein YgcG